MERLPSSQNPFNSEDLYQKVKSLASKLKQGMEIKKDDNFDTWLESLDSKITKIFSSFRNNFTAIRMTHLLDRLIKDLDANKAPINLKSSRVDLEVEASRKELDAQLFQINKIIKAIEETPVGKSKYFFEMKKNFEELREKNYSDLSNMFIKMPFRFVEPQSSNEEITPKVNHEVSEIGKQSQNESINTLKEEPLTSEALQTSPSVKEKTVINEEKQDRQDILNKAQRDLLNIAERIDPVQSKNLNLFFTSRSRDNSRDDEIMSQFLNDLVNKLKINLDERPQKKINPTFLFLNMNYRKNLLAQIQQLKNVVSENSPNLKSRVTELEDRILKEIYIDENFPKIEERLKLVSNSENKESISLRLSVARNKKNYNEVKVESELISRDVETLLSAQEGTTNYQSYRGTLTKAQALAAVNQLKNQQLRGETNQGTSSSDT